MFTGIIETLGHVIDSNKDGSNIHFTIKSNLTSELKIDQSIAHDGVCLTVTSLDLKNSTYNVTAIKETLKRTSLGKWTKGSMVNLERCMPANGRFDGHIVQGHVDQKAKVEKIEEEDGSWKFRFKYDETKGNLTVEKGSICINGVSLTVVDSENDSFSVAIIPYTYEHTNFKNLIIGDEVNLEFDIIGKYISKILKHN